MRGGLTCFTLLILILTGCKKKETPPPSLSMPLPEKSVHKNVSAAKQTSAKTDAQPVMQQQGKPVAPEAKQIPSKPDSAVAKQVPGKPEVHKQVSSVRIPPPQAGISLDFTNRRDPFKPFIQVPAPSLSGAGKSRKVLKDLLPIQSFDTEKFKVSGIITGIKENSALVIDPVGKGYVVKAGMLIGNNDGRIKRITDSSVEIEESFRDDNGRVRKRLVRLTLIRKK